MNTCLPLLFSLLIRISFHPVVSAPPPSRPAIIPIPVEMDVSEGIYQLSKKITILASTESDKKTAAFLTDFLVAHEIETAVITTGRADFVLFSGDRKIPNKEGYQLVIDENGITINASQPIGIFYGIQSFIQIFQSANTDLPYLKINDEPRFSYRGMHLDVGRHLFEVGFIKKYLDMMAHFKFNTFHWHLTEDQGWRIEVKQYPKLQEVAAYRKETVVGHASTRTRDEAQYDGKRYGGFYTREQIREIVAYANDRFITIIPEIELPGHAQAALGAYPFLGCVGEKYETATTWGVFDDIFCAGKETTFEFLENVLEEVLPLFPGQYVHIGGDEAPKTNWKNCPHCQQRIKKEGLKDEHELQSYFIRRIEKYLNKKGKTIIGWDEILEGGLAPNAVVMSWRGEKGGIEAARQNHQVIMTPGNWCYFDHYQADPKNEPLAIGNLTTVEEVYGYEPIPKDLSETESAFILGAQCNVWTEYMLTGDHVEYMVYPRAIALSEVVWSTKDSRDYGDFLNRIKTIRPLMDQWGIHYATHIFQSDE